MTIYLDTEEDELNELLASINTNVGLSPTVHVTELPPEQSAQVTNTQGIASVLNQIPKPRFNDSLDQSKLSPVPENAQRVSRAASSINSAPINLSSIFDIAGDEQKEDEFAEVRTALDNMRPIPHTDDEITNFMNLDTEETITQATPFPYLALEIVRLGLAKENYETNVKLAGYKKQADEHKSKIDTLLKLSAQLPRLTSDDGSYQLQPEVKAEIERLTLELREKGIDIFPGMEFGEELKKEQLAGANSLINHYIDQNRTSLQELFTTKISTVIQFLTMLNEVMKKIVERDDQMKRKTLENR